jgi:hypothetical protein
VPLPRPINDAHSAAPDFFQNVIIPYSPIGVAYVELAKHVIKGFLDLGGLGVFANALGE